MMLSNNSPTKISGQRVIRSTAIALVILGMTLSATQADAQRRHARARLIQDPYIVRTQGINLDEEEDAKPRDARIVSMPKSQHKMEVIHHRSQLMVFGKRVTRIAISDPSVLEAAPYSEKELSLIGLALGTTTLTLWFEGDKEPLIYLVKTIRDPSVEERMRVDYGKLERKLAILFPNSKVYLIPLSGKIVVKGEARDSEEAARILQIVRGEVISQNGSLGGPQPYGNGNGGIGGGGNRVRNTSTNGGNNGNGRGSSYVVNMLNVPGEFTVMMRVRIAELNRSQLDRMGIDINYLINGGRHSVGTFLASGAGTLNGIFENGEVNVLIDALASNGTATVLSEPVLTVLSGHSASFLSGGEFAVPTIVGVGGAQGSTTTFRGFGTSLIVTPTVIDGDLIRMQIVPEFSAINAGNSVGGIPGLDSRRVQTTVELREGQTIVIGGLLHRQRNTEVTRIPLLGEIPWLGPMLFNAKVSTEDETELIILVTPEIVRPMEPDEVPPVPGFYVTHPTRHELYKYAKTEGAPNLGVFQLAPYGNYHGHGENVGFRVHNPAPASPQYAPVPSANQRMSPNQGMQYPPQSSMQGQRGQQQYAGQFNGGTRQLRQQAPVQRTQQPMQNYSSNAARQPQRRGQPIQSQYRPSGNQLQSQNTRRPQRAPNYSNQLFGTPRGTQARGTQVRPASQQRRVFAPRGRQQGRSRGRQPVPVRTTGHTLPRR